MRIDAHTRKSLGEYIHMKNKFYAALTALGALAITASPALANMAKPAIPATAPKAMDFGAVPRLNNVQISPNGKHIGAIISLDGKTRQIAIWDTANLKAPPKIIPGTKDLTFQSFSFIKDDRLWITVSQYIDIDGSRTFSYRQLLTDLTGSFFTVLARPNAGVDQSKAGVMYETRSEQRGFGGMNLVHSLPLNPDYVWAQETGTRDLYKVNVHAKGNLNYERVLSGSETYQQYLGWDSKEVRARSKGDSENGQIVNILEFKSPEGKWEEHFRTKNKDRRSVQFGGCTKDPNIVYILKNTDTDVYKLYTYNISEKKIIDVVFEHPVFDVTANVKSYTDPDILSNPDSRGGASIGFRYEGPQGSEVYWTDEKLSNIQKGLELGLGHKTQQIDWTDIVSGKPYKLTVSDNFSIQIISLSTDRKSLIIEKSGPQTPPEYYLYVDGKGLSPLGKAQPQINTDALGTNRLVQFKARDGLMIPAFVTAPNEKYFGKGPYPAIVVPHGGPWSRDNWDWDVTGWTQYFAARGYVVIQPQFRGSMGWGDKLWKAGDQQWGLKMSDDNDDAATWLIEQGLAQKGHIALHGYSYGGFAALAAGVRGASGPFRCAISGAGVADSQRFQNELGLSKASREYQGWTISGMNPWDKFAETSIPMMIYHGDRDQRVPLREGQGMYEKLKSLGKPVKFLVLKNMGHDTSKWNDQNVNDVLLGVEDYLEKDCGPGGIRGS